MSGSTAITVKAFIVDQEKVLLMKRRQGEIFAPGSWDIPGSRLDHGENPYLGLKRGVKNETNLDVEIKQPLDVHHFTRDDGQVITMIVFLCRPLGAEVELSDEHEHHDWVDVDDVKARIDQDWWSIVDHYDQYRFPSGGSGY